MKALFIGVGSIGRRHIRDFYNECKTHGIVPDIHALRRACTDLDNDLNQMVTRQITDVGSEHYDVIFVTNPTFLHQKALEDTKGKGDYYFIEKPIFDRSADCLEQLGINEMNAYVAAPMRHTQIYKELKRIVKNEKVYSARIICSSYLPDWRPNIDYRQNYSAIREMGGGVSLDLIHEIDYMVGLFGDPEKCTYVHGRYSDLEISSDDLGVYIAEYPSMLCEVHLDYFGRKYRRQCEVFTRDGTYLADFYTQKILKPDGGILDCTDVADAEFKHEMEYFYGFINGSGEIVNSPEHSLKVLRCALGEWRK